MNEQPALSFCIPTYNRAARVYSCVKHILQYDGMDIEVVVTDNASDDNTWELLNTICDKRLRIFRNEDSIGAFNWTYVLSKANGHFAALMSDEDHVFIENVAYYTEFLSKSDNANKLGAVIYHYPPKKNIFRKYRSPSQHQAFMAALKYGGHITCHILNSALYKEQYKDIYSFGKVGMHFSMLLAIAQKHPVILSDIPLVRWGEPVYNPLKKTRDKSCLDPEVFGGHAPANSFRLYEMLLDNTHKGFAYSAKTEKLYFQCLSFSIWRISSFYCKVIASPSRIEKEQSESGFPWHEVSNMMDLNRNQVIINLNDWFCRAIQRIVELTNDVSWNLLCKTFEDAMNMKSNEPVDEKLSLPQRILLGDTVFLICKNFFDLSDDNCGMLGFQHSSAMKLLLDYGFFDSVLAYNAPKNTRTEFIYGRAHLGKKDWKNAEKCFRYFVDRIENPSCLCDIVTGIMSVPYAYWYLGICLCEQGNDAEADSFFQKSRSFADEYLIDFFLPQDDYIKTV